MILCMPVQDGHEWTRRAVASLAETVRGDFRLVVWDNASEVPYTRDEFGETPFPFNVHRVEENVGYYAPIFSFYAHYQDEVIGLMHNDVLVHEVGWDRRLTECFREVDRLGAVGFVGSYEVDDNGGRGAGTMCFFREKDAQGNVIGQPQAAGERIGELRPSLVLDSLVMVFRREAVARLARYDDATDLPLAHFYDKIWPLRLVSEGWRVGTLGVEVSHWGGITIVANKRYIEDCRGWCWARGVREVPNNDWQLQMYREGERRLFEEFKHLGGLVPSSIGLDWVVRRTQA